MTGGPVQGEIWETNLKCGEMSDENMNLKVNNKKSIRKILEN